MARRRSFLDRLLRPLRSQDDARPPIGAALERAVHARAGNDCELCGLPFWPGDRRHAHHWVAFKLGGPTRFDNLGSVHEHCNLRVGARPRAEALQLARSNGHLWREAARQNRIARRLLSV